MEDSAIANHFLCDFNKGIKETSKKLLPSNFAFSTQRLFQLFQMIIPIIGFYDQLENYSSKGDCLVTMSCSGNSKIFWKLLNMLKAKNFLSFHYQVLITDPF